MTLLAIEGVLQIAAAVAQDDRLGTLASGEHTRMLCVGDSHTFGVYLPREQSYPYQLEQLLNQDQARRYAVINAGYPGRNTATVLRLLPAQLDLYHPHVVLLLAGLNNRWNTVDRDALEVDARGGFAKLVHFVATRSRLVKLLSIVRTRWQSRTLTQPIDPEIPAQPLPETRAPDLGADVVRKVTADDLVRAITLCREHGALPILLTYAADAPAFTALQLGIRDAAEHAGCALVDNESVFRALRANQPEGDLLFPNDWHPKGAGYAVMAEAIARKLFDLHLIDKLPQPVAAVDSQPPALALKFERREHLATLVLTGEANRPFRILLSHATEPPYMLFRSIIPLCPDRLFMAALRQRFLTGRLDAAGHATVVLPEVMLKLLAHQPSFAAAVTLIDDGREHHPLMQVISVSNPVAIHQP